MEKKIFGQIFKYGIVGVINTLLTAIIIWIMLKWVYGVKEESEASVIAMSVSNFTGYGIGLINSFIFNRNWTFKSKCNWKIGLIKFLLAFVLCYIIQLGIVLLLNAYFSIPTVKFTFFNKNYFITSAYICQLIGIISYTGLNFICNKYYTFKK